MAATEPMGNRGPRASVQPIMQATLSLIPSLLLALLVGCADDADAGRTDGASPTQQARAGGDCVSPFHFQKREYRLAMEVKTVVPASELGHGSYESCDQYFGGSDRLMEPRRVYGFPDLPSEQAIVLTNAKGRGFPLLATDEPDDGRDADLRARMKGPARASIRLPVGHCWIDPFRFEGVTWAVAPKDQFGWGAGHPRGWDGSGTIERLSQSSSKYVDSGGHLLRLVPADDPEAAEIFTQGCD